MEGLSKKIAIVAADGILDERLCQQCSSLIESDAHALVAFLEKLPQLVPIIPLVFWEEASPANLLSTEARKSSMRRPDPETGDIPLTDDQAWAVLSYVLRAIQSADLNAQSWKAKTSGNGNARQDLQNALKPWAFGSVLRLDTQHRSLRVVLSALFAVVFTFDEDIGADICTALLTNETTPGLPSSTKKRLWAGDMSDLLSVRIFQKYAELCPMAFLQHMARILEKKEEINQRAAIMVLAFVFQRSESLASKMVHTSLWPALLSHLKCGQDPVEMSAAIWCLIVVLPYLTAHLPEDLPDLLFVLKKALLMQLSVPVCNSASKNEEMCAPRGTTDVKRQSPNQSEGNRSMLLSRSESSVNRAPSPRGWANSESCGAAASPRRESMAQFCLMVLPEERIRQIDIFVEGFDGLEVSVSKHIAGLGLVVENCTSHDRRFLEVGVTHQSEKVRRFTFYLNEGERWVGAMCVYSVTEPESESLSSATDREENLRAIKLVTNSRESDWIGEVETEAVPRLSGAKHLASSGKAREGSVYPRRDGGEEVLETNFVGLSSSDPGFESFTASCGMVQTECEPEPDNCQCFDGTKGLVRSCRVQEIKGLSGIFDGERLSRIRFLEQASYRSHPLSGSHAQVHEGSAFISSLFQFLYSIFPAHTLQYLKHEVTSEPRLKLILAPLMGDVCLHPGLLEEPEAELSGMEWKRWPMERVREEVDTFCVQDAGGRCCLSCRLLQKQVVNTVDDVGCATTTQPANSDVSIASRISGGVAEWRAAQPISKERESFEPRSDRCFGSHLESTRENSTANVCEIWSSDVGSLQSMALAGMGKQVPLCHRVLILKHELAFERSISENYRREVRRLRRSLLGNKAAEAEAKAAKEELQRQREQSQRLQSVIDRHRFQIQNWKKEQEKWQRDLQLKLSKFALERKRLSEQNIGLQGDLARKERVVDELRAQLNQVQHSALRYEVELQDVQKKAAAKEEWERQCEDLSKELAMWEEYHEAYVAKVVTARLAEKDDTIHRMAKRLEILEEDVARSALLLEQSSMPLSSRFDPSHSKSRLSRRLMTESMLGQIDSTEDFACRTETIMGEQDASWSRSFPGELQRDSDSRLNLETDRASERAEQKGGRRLQNLSGSRSVKMDTASVSSSNRLSVGDDTSTLLGDSHTLTDYQYRISVLEAEKCEQAGTITKLRSMLEQHQQVAEAKLTAVTDKFMRLKAVNGGLERHVLHLTSQLEQRSVQLKRCQRERKTKESAATNVDFGQSIEPAVKVRATRHSDDFMLTRPTQYSEHGRMNGTSSDSGSQRENVHAQSALHQAEGKLQPNSDYVRRLESHDECRVKKLPEPANRQCANERQQGRVAEGY